MTARIRTLRVPAVLVVLAVAIWLATLVLSDYNLTVANEILLLIIPALGFKLLMGNAGEFSFGSAAFLGIGAFTAGALSTVGVSFVPGVLLGGVLAMVVGALVQIPALRLASYYVVFATLALQFVTSWALTKIQGDNFSGYVLPPAKFGPVTLGLEQRSWFVFLAIVAIVVWWMTRNLLRSRYGRGWNALREHRRAPSTSGVSVPRFRMIAVSYSAFLFGLAGALTAYYVGGAVASTYANLTLAIQYVIIVLLGGLYSLWGPVLGSIVLIELPLITENVLGGDSLGAGGSNAAIIGQLVAAFLVIVVLMIEPGGLADLVRRVAKALVRLVRPRPSPAAVLPATASPLGAAAAPAPATSASSVAVVSEPAPTAPAVAASRSASPPAARADAAISVADLAVRYGAGAAVIQNVDLVVAKGTAVAVLGPNGAGKTTLMRALAGFPPAARATVTASELTIMSTDVRRKHASDVARLGLRFIPERDKVFRGLSVGDHLRLSAPRGSRERKAALETVYGIFPRLAEVPAKRQAGMLSGGERQMLAVGTVLAARPSVIVIDEPSLGLAPVAIRNLAEALKRLVTDNGITLVFSDQNVSLARELADEVHVLSGGGVEALGAGNAVDWNRVEALYLGGGASEDAVEGPEKVAP